MFGIRKDREIIQRITKIIDHKEKGPHADLVRDMEAQGTSREGRDTCGGGEEDKFIGRKFYITVMSGKL